MAKKCLIYSYRVYYNLLNSNFQEKNKRGGTPSVASGRSLGMEDRRKGQEVPWPGGPAGPLFYWGREAWPWTRTGRYSSISARAKFIPAIATRNSMLSLTRPARPRIGTNVRNFTP